MAKKDDKPARQLVTDQIRTSQSNLDDLRRDTLIPQNQEFWNQYQSAIPQDQADYARLSEGYDQFAKTGGFSSGDLASIRSRAVSPMRAVYANAGREVDRQRSLQGGYSPGFGTLKARMAREQGQGISDASTNAEAAIAQMVQQGKMAGLTGGSSLYAATPGRTSMFGNQVIDSTRNRLGGEQIQSGLGTTNPFGGTKGSGYDWASIAKMIGTGAGVAAMASDRNIKEDIKPVESDDIISKFKRLPISEWKYKGDKTPHIGPMAQDFKRIFGKGDGKTISYLDAIGTSLAMNKAIADKL